MHETSKSKKHFGPLARSVLCGSGIDIGCGPDPVAPDVRRFDLEDGDANVITRFVHEQFDFVYSSHCLEHMRDPRAALLEWWQLVRPGGHLFFIVPDEDLYEQGVWPSRFNGDHKATFSLDKQTSWSPVSVNVRELAGSLPGGELRHLALQDHGYDRRLQRTGPDRPPAAPLHFIIRAYNGLRRLGIPRFAPFEHFKSRYFAIDQTVGSDRLAQIECIVRKRPDPPAAGAPAENPSVPAPRN